MHQKGFYNWNALERVLLYECIGKCLLFECTEQAFATGMLWKVFYYWNALERVLLLECIGKGFTIRILWKGHKRSDTKTAWKCLFVPVTSTNEILFKRCNTRKANTYLWFYNMSGSITWCRALYQWKTRELFFFLFTSEHSLSLLVLSLFIYIYIYMYKIITSEFQITLPHTHTHTQISRHTLTRTRRKNNC